MLLILPKLLDICLYYLHCEPLECSKTLNIRRGSLPTQPPSLFSVFRLHGMISTSHLKNLITTFSSNLFIPYILLTSAIKHIHANDDDDKMPIYLSIQMPSRFHFHHKIIHLPFFSLLFTRGKAQDLYFFFTIESQKKKEIKKDRKEESRLNGALWHNTEGEKATEWVHSRQEDEEEAVFQ